MSKETQGAPVDGLNDNLLPKDQNSVHYEAVQNMIGTYREVLYLWADDLRQKLAGDLPLNTTAIVDQSQRFVRYSSDLHDMINLPSVEDKQAALEGSLQTFQVELGVNREALESINKKFPHLHSRGDLDVELFPLQMHDVRNLLSSISNLLDLSSSYDKGNLIYSFIKDGAIPSIQEILSGESRDKEFSLSSIASLIKGQQGLVNFGDELQVEVLFEGQTGDLGSKKVVWSQTEFMRLVINCLRNSRDIYKDELIEVLKEMGIDDQNLDPEMKLHDLLKMIDIHTVLAYIGRIDDPTNKLKQILRLTRENGRVEIIISSDDDYAIIGVRNFGRHFSDTFLQNGFEKGKTEYSGGNITGHGYGMYGVVERLKARGGGVELVNHFDDEGHPDGVTMTFSIPLKKDSS